MRRIGTRVRHVISSVFRAVCTRRNVNLTTARISVRRHVVIVSISRGHSRQLILVGPRLLRGDNRANVRRNYLSVPRRHTLIPHTRGIGVHTLSHSNGPFRLRTSNLLTVYVRRRVSRLINGLFVSCLSPLGRRHVHRGIRGLSHLGTQTWKWRLAYRGRCMLFLQMRLALRHIVSAHYYLLIVASLTYSPDRASQRSTMGG